MKANITPELFAKRRRQITDADVRRYLGDMLADRRVTGPPQDGRIARSLEANGMGSVEGDD